MLPNTTMLLLLGLAVLLGPDVYKAVASAGADAGSSSSAPRLDADKGLSAGGKVHVAFCTS
jgi:hypothetical protein